VNREEFGKALKGHDWYYAYSDDHRVWQRGKQRSSALRSQHAQLECPFDMHMLRKWAHSMIVDQFAEEEPGEWYRQPRKYKSVAPCTRANLITQKEYDEVTLWMSLGASIEGVSQIV